MKIFDTEPEQYDWDHLCKWYAIIGKFSGGHGVKNTVMGFDGIFLYSGNKFVLDKKLKITCDQDYLIINQRFHRIKKRDSLHVTASSREFSDVILTLFAMME